MFFITCYYKFLDIHKKISVLEFLFNKVTGLMAHSFIKKKPQHRYCQVNITECMRKAFFCGTPAMAAS